MPGAASSGFSESTSLPDGGLPDGGLPDGGESEAVRPHVREIWTPSGAARLHVELPAGGPRGLLMLGHSAGGGPDASDLLAVRTLALGVGLAVVRTEQPYRVAGRRAPAPAPRLDEAWQACVVGARSEPGLGGIPLVAGGRSNGARVACRTAHVVGAVRVLALAFPLHPPSSPHRTRLPELADAGVPVLVVQGSRDLFGSAGEMRDQLGLASAPDDIEVVEAPGADHSLRQVAPTLDRVGEWLVARLP